MDQGRRGHGVYSRYLHAGSYTYTLTGFDGFLSPRDEFADVVMYIGREMDQVIAEAVAEFEPLPGDLMGMVIRGRDENGYEVEIGITLRPWEELTTERVLEAIINSLNSNQSLELNFTVVVSLLRIREGNLDNVQGGFRQTVKGDVRKFIYAKRGLVQINPESDHVNNNENCFAQFIVIALAQLIKKEELAPIDELKLDGLSYKQLVGPSRQFKHRQEFTERLNALVDCSQPSAALVEELQDRFGVHIVLFKVFPLGEVAFPKQLYRENKPTLYGLLTSDPVNSDQFTHVDVVILVTSLFTKLGSSNRSGIRFCNLCLEPYVAKRGCNLAECAATSYSACHICHKCSFQCQACSSEGCEKLNLVTCNHCHLPCNSEPCLQRHLQCCSELNCKRCELCGRKAHNGLACGHMRCFFCSCTYTYDDRTNHQCFIKREKLKKWNDKWAVFDFECALSETKVHVPYLCTVWFPNGAPEGLELEFHHENVQGDKVFVFWGMAKEGVKEGVNLFYELLVHDSCNNYVFFAHNARAYDAILVKYHMLRYKKLTSSDVKRGLKYLNMKFAELGVEIRDSLSFIPSRLASMSTDFGIAEYAKGHFPHSIISVDFLEQSKTVGYLNPKPPRDAFQNDFTFGSSGVEQKAELDSWLEVFYSNEDLWNVKEEAVRYCISDTLLLGKALQIFQETFREMTGAIERDNPAVFDVLSYVTLPSAMMSFYLSQLLPMDQIGVIDSAAYSLKREAYCGFHSLRHELGDFEVLDDWTAQFENLTVLYRDCYTHGCRMCFKQIYRNDRMNLPFSVCKGLSFKEEQEALLKYPRLRILWKHDINWKTLVPPEDELPLLPRDAYKGGKVEVFKHCYNGEIQMVDYVSQYPTTLLGESVNPFDLEGDSICEWRMPIGTPVRKSELDLDQEGVAKCFVLPPQNCWNPFLSLKIFTSLKNYEIMYGCCRICMQDRIEECTHNAEERSFCGTWTIVELRHAVRNMGYRITKVVDVMEYPSSSTTLFKNFIVPFMTEKILSKKQGLVENDVFTEKGLSIQGYIQQFAGRQVVAADFKDSPARRTVAKLAMNSFTGKWGQSEIQKSSKTFDETQITEARALMTNPNVTLCLAEVVQIDETLLLNIDYEPRFQSARNACRKNDMIVAHITANGRIMLANLETHIGQKNMIYEDTDSGFHGMLATPVYKHGFGFGELELELRQGKNFVSGGKKWYSFQKMDGTNVCKIKGFTVKDSNARQFFAENLRKHVWSFKPFYEERSELPEECDFAKIAVKQVLFKTEMENKLLPQKRTHEMTKKTGFRYLNTKRRCIFTNERDIDTLPYGYKE